MQILFLVGGAILILIISYFSSQLRKKRLGELAELSNQLGLAFYPEGIQIGTSHNLLGLEFTTRQDALIKHLALFDLFRQGNNQKAAPAMRGTIDGITWLLFDYSYQTTSSDGETTTTTTHPFSVCVATVPYVVPILSLEPQNFLHGIGKALGARELSVESEEFNRRYFITSSDVRSAMDLLNPIAIDRLLNQPTRTWKMVGPYVMVYTAGYLKPEEFGGLFMDMKQFVASVPTYFKQDHGYNPN